MRTQDISPELRKELIKAQRTEITEYHIYTRLSRMVKDKNNSEVLARIGRVEGNHAEYWSHYTGITAKPILWKLITYYVLARVFGITFGIKLMENREEAAQVNYAKIIEAIPVARKVHDEEEEHENDLIKMIEEERLSYMGSVVLGLNDALVELTGALAGLTLALQNTSLIAVSGLITGIAASMSMAASEYLSQKSEGQGSRAVKSSIYTGITYIFTVIILILPYLLVPNVFVALIVTLALAAGIIAAFNFYVSVAQDLKFASRFWEMTILSFSIAALSFGIGYLIRAIFGVDV
ncbi:MAG: VIT1/CCC1 transporter family protein [Spirochaetaceae bacterium]